MNHLRKRPDSATALINIRVGREGIVDVAFTSDSGTEATRAHELLSQVTDELRALHLALCAAAIRREVEAGEDRATLDALRGGYDSEG